MDSIYHKASRFLVWLGHAYAADEFEALKTVAEINERYFVGLTEGFVGQWIPVAFPCETSV